MKRIGFLGAGSIATAMLNGFIESGYITAEQVIVTNRSNVKRLEELRNTYGVQTTTDAMSLVQNCDYLFLFMKPQDVATSLAPLAPFIREDHTIVSVLAGVTMETIAGIIGKSCGIIRSMP
ncbi:MAG: NAD(P)-binding domain-containing protein, partial [Bacilli bacterium]